MFLFIVRSAYERFALKEITITAKRGQVQLHCSGMDSFEPVLARLMAAFCIRNYGGIFDDPQSGRYYDNAEELEQEIAAAVDDLSAEAEKGNLRTHPFEGWL